MHKLNELQTYVYTLIPMELFLFRYVLNTQGENICVILQKLYKYIKYFTKVNTQDCVTVGNNHECLVKIFTISLLLSLCALAVILCILDRIDEADIWTFGHKIYNKIMIRILSFYGNIIWYSFCTFFVLMTFFLCIIFYRCIEV